MAAETIERQVEFDGNTGHSLRGRLLIPRDAPSRAPVVMMLTGDGPKGTKSLSWINLPPLLAAHGIGSFLFDFHGLGYSDGRREELSLSVGLKNALAALDVLLGMPEINKRRVFALGSSFGGNIAVLLASARLDAFASLGLKSPVSFYPGSLAQELGIEQLRFWAENRTQDTDSQLYLDSLQINTYAHASDILCPVLITHGDSDPIVPMEQSVHLYAALQKAPTQLSIYQGVDHHYSQAGAWDRMAEEFVNFFRRQPILEG